VRASLECSAPFGALGFARGMFVTGRLAFRPRPPKPWLRPLDNDATLEPGDRRKNVIVILPAALVRSAPPSRRQCILHAEARQVIDRGDGVSGLVEILSAFPT
jgi:hypothetical protein